ncbi:protein-tyrosine phosphatase-like protein, partial [Elsinoe ampelina]
MVPPPVPGSIKFDGILNVRDVGLFTNAISGKHRMKPGLLYRSARPDFASPSDRDTLQSTLKIHTILDLRSKTEKLQLATRNTPPPPSLSPPETNPLLPPATPSPPPPLPITTLPIPLNGPLFQLRLISLLPLLSILRLITLYLLGQRLPAIRILAAAMSPRGLTGLATDSLLSSWREMRCVFSALAREENWPVMIHCTQGKDRTGLVVLLLELLCGVEGGACERDYLASEKGLEGGREERIREIEEVGMPREWVDC